MQKRHLLLMVLVAAALAALLVACGTANGPDLQFDATAYDAAAELQPAEAITVEPSISGDATSQPESPGVGSATESAVAAMETAPALYGDSARHGYVHHDRIVQIARSASLTTSKMTHPAEARSSHQETLVSTSVDAPATYPAEGTSEDAAINRQASDSTAVAVLDTPEAALQEASFTLVTVETDEGEQVIFVPSEGYEKVCPHRLRMASEFADF